jgi:hypothetical protein
MLPLENVYLCGDYLSEWCVCAIYYYNPYYHKH